jgi:hypothetical protein
MKKKLFIITIDLLFMKQYLVLISILFVQFPCDAQNRPAPSWDEVQKLEQQSLPKSALDAVTLIYDNAVRQGDSPVIIKSLLYRLKYMYAIDRDSLPEMIREIERQTANAEGGKHRAVLNSMLSELYSMYYLSNRYTVNQRTAAAIENDDIETWPANMFIRRIADCALLSLQPAGELQSADALEYRDVVTCGADSRELRPTLYDFLVRRAIELLEQYAADYSVQNFFPQTMLSGRRNFADAGEFVKDSTVAVNGYDFVPTVTGLYRDLLAFRLRDGNRFALLMADLDRLEFVARNTAQSSEFYLAALDRLERQYSDEQYCVEVLLAKVNLLAENGDEKQVYGICLDGIERYPDYRRTENLRARINTITQSRFSIVSDNTVYPGRELKLKLDYRNLNELRVDIYRINASATDYTDRWNRNGKYGTDGTLTGTVRFGLRNDFPYAGYDTVLTVPAPSQPGGYEYVIYPEKHVVDGRIVDGEDLTVNRQFSVSRLATVSRTADGRREYIVTDRMSGKPVAGASVHLYSNNGNKLVETKTVTTDKNGLAVSPADNGSVSYYNATAGDDRALTVSPVPWISTGYNSDNSRLTLDLFTDRSIYRPCQTVSFKGIAYRLKDSSVIPGKAFTIGLYDDNSGKEIVNKLFTTNEYGSFSGEFTLPQGVLNGNFSIRSQAGSDGYGYAAVRIEEYRKPSFDISFDTVGRAYRFGDEVITGGNVRSFSGVNAGNAAVKYRITRSYHGFCRIWKQPVQVASGETSTDESGRFNIVFFPERAFEDNKRENVAYVYEVEATVTDIKGETQTNSARFGIGNISTVLSLSGLTENTDRNKIPTVRVDAKNLDGNRIDVKCTLQVFSLKQKNDGELNVNDENRIKNKPVFEREFESNSDLDLSKHASFEPGRYRIIATAQDAEPDSTDVTFYSTTAKRPPVPVYEWLVPLKTECLAGEKAELLYGSSAKGVYVLYEIFNGNRRLSSSRFILNNEVRRIEIPYLESYGDGVTASFLFIKDEKVFHKEVPVSKKAPDNKLSLNMETFRDKLLPGQNEEWKISVKDADGRGVAGELLASMYDAALDKIKTHGWRFNPVGYSRPANPVIITGADFDDFFSNRDLPFHPYKSVDLMFDSFNWFGINIYGNSRRPGNVLRSYALAESADLIEKKTITADTADGIGSSADQDDSDNNAPLQLRRNFAETAFFYPHITTGETGEAVISFTVPESNTTWKFMALAHSKDLKFGQLVKEAISRKQLMVEPNIPRFIRNGDRATVTTAIHNLSDSALSGTVRIEFFDPVTGQPSIAVTDGEQQFNAAAGRTVSASWTFNVPRGIDLTAVKIIASTAGFSDGEQHLLPVLPNRISVTESIPLNVTDSKTRTFAFADGKASSTREDYRMTLELTANPVWYAVQALPAITAPQSDNVIDWFAAYYSNSLATELANSNPKIRQIVDAWTRQAGTKETLLSNLEKNRELKAVLLEETPWVVAAGDETEQLQRLALLFDVNRANDLNRRALEKLRSMQQADGGWAWFPGMRSNVSITRWILLGLGNIGKTSAENPEIRDITEKAISFIDNEFRKHYEQTAKLSDTPQKVIPSTADLEFMLVRSMYRNIPLGQTKNAYDFYLAQTERHWAQTPTMYDRAVSAQVLHRNNKLQPASAIIKSLREHATRKPDFGMYWANDRAASSFGFHNPVCVHTFIMNAFYEIESTPREMDEMKLWLLRQKQTQQWESTPATVGAVQALLKTGSDRLSSSGTVDVRWGDRTLTTAQGDAGSGYIKQTADRKEITTAMSKVTITRLDETPAWGALYRQYFEDIDKITASSTGLKIEKMLFTEKITTSGRTLAPIDGTNPLKTGDKVIVRLTVRADRDFEYVMLKDMRASCFEPVEQLSGTEWKQGVVYYRSPKDASMNYYFHNLPKGVYVFEYSLYATATGEYSAGIATLQSMYSPEFTAHTGGATVRVVPK